MRRFQTDVPANTPIRRKGIIKARQSSAIYLVDVHGANGSASVAVWEGSTLLDLGTTVTIEFDSTINAWWIVS